MAAGEDVAYYTLPVILSFDGVNQQIQSGVGRKLESAGVEGGRDFGSGMADGLKSSLKQAEAAVKKFSQNVAKLRDKEADSIGKLRVAEERLQEMRDRGVTGSRLAAAEEARERALRAQTTATRNLRQETQQLVEARADLANASDDAADSMGGLGEDGGDDSGGGFMVGFAGAIRGLGTKLGPVGIALAATVGIATGIGAAIAGEITAGMDREVSRDRVQAALALDDATMAKFATSAGTVYADNFGESLDDVQEAMAAVAGTFGTDDTAMMENLTAQAITFRDVYGTEVNEALATAQALVSSGLAANADEAFDLLAKSFSAATPMMRDEIPALVREYGGVFNSLGLDGQEAFGMLVNASKVSEFAMDKVGDSLKELTLLATDLGNEPVQTMFAEWGLAGEDVANNLLAGGQVANDQLDVIVDKLLAIKDPAQQAQAAISLFGTPLEDLNKAEIPAFLNSLDTASAAMEGFEGAGDDMVTTAGDNAAGTIESAMRDLEIARNGMQDDLAQVAAPYLEDLAGWVEEHKEQIVNAFTEIGAGVVGMGSFIAISAGQGIVVFGKLAQAVGDTAGWIVDAMAEVVGTVAAALEALPDEFVPDGWVEGLRGAQQSLSDTSNTLHDTGTDITAFGEDVLGAGVSLAQMAGALHNGTIEANEFTTAIMASGDGIEVLPDGKSFTLESNTPEVQAQLEELGFTVTEMPDGTVTVTANTAEAQSNLDTFVAGAAKAGVVIPVTARVTGMTADPNVSFTPTPGAAPVMLGPGYALGAIRAAAMGDIGGLPNQALIQPETSGLVQWAERGTGGESFIPLANDHRRPRALDIWAQTGQLLGVRGFDQGGVLGDNGGLMPFTTQLKALVGQTWPQITDIGGYRSPDGYNEHSSGRALDVMIPGWQSPAGIALGDQIAEWALSIPGVNRVMWQQSIIRPGGDRTPVEDRGSPTQNHMDHVHIFTDNVPVGSTPTPTMSMGAMSNASATSGLGPNGEAGTYTVDAGAVAEAEGAVAEADAKVRELAAKNEEIKANTEAAESERIAAQNDLDSAKRDAAEARTDLASAKQGEFTAASDSAADSAGSSGPQTSEIGGIASSFLKETFGIDGSWLPDIGNLFPVQLADTLLSSFMPAGQTGTSSAPFGLPDIPATEHGGTGGLPGPLDAAGKPTSISVDMSQNFNGSQLGWDPVQVNAVRDKELRQRSIPRISGMNMGVGN